MNSSIAQKASRVLNVILLSFLLILMRVWYLACLQHDEHVEASQKPKRRTVIEKVERASIKDRFNEPLAVNKIQYDAAICYADIRQIPARKWEVKNGKKERVQPRLRYIEDLAKKLSLELALEPQAIEDLIHGKASLFPHTPFVVKENLSEEEYYRLKALEKDWAGLRTQRNYHRAYPHGKVAGDLIGHMGSISHNEYTRVAKEIKELQQYFAERNDENPPILPKGFNNPLEVRERLKTLQERSYTIHDLVGKAGAEYSLDAQLRGYAGKKHYEIDTKGNVVRELPGGRDAMPGHALNLSISRELQQLAEELLIAHESRRELRHLDGTPDLGAPWIKGGAIVAMNPKTGEIVAMASYPRIDPNDFVPATDPAVKEAKQLAKHKWLETETYIANLWDGKQLLERERFHPVKKQVYDETLLLSWDRYIEAVLDPYSKVKEALDRIPSVKAAYDLVTSIKWIAKVIEEPDIKVVISALYPTGSENSNVQRAIAKLKEERETLLPLTKALDNAIGSIPLNQDKLLLLDLCQLHTGSVPLSSELQHHLRSVSLEKHLALTQAAACIKERLKISSKQTFHTQHFPQFRAEHFQEYLKEKRREEKEKKRYAKPYTDYLEKLEKTEFQRFWEQNASSLLYATLFEEGSLPGVKAQLGLLKKEMLHLPEELRKEWLGSLRSFHEMTDPLFGSYRKLRKTAEGKQELKHLAAGFYPLSGFGYGRSQAFQQSTPQGSVFKPIVAYQAMIEKYAQLRVNNPSFSTINPLVITDEARPHPGHKSPKQILGYTEDNKPILRGYKGGHLLKSHTGIGKIDVMGALEQSSNIYFSLLAVDHIEDPLTLIDTCKAFGFGTRTGVELPTETAGNLPQDLADNRTGLYAFAIGQHSLIVTPLQTALMFSAFANKGVMHKPTIIQKVTGQEPLQDYQDPFSEHEYPFQEPLSLIGIDFPLFTAVCKQADNPYVWEHAPEIRNKLFFPNCIHQPLIEGMARVLTGIKGTARPQIIRGLQGNYELTKYYQSLKNQLIGKTGTAEVLYKHTLDAETKAEIRNHIWFGGIAYSEQDQQRWEDPELVVTVYLRFSSAGGKEGAPLAAEIIRKYRELCQREKLGERSVSTF